MDVFCGFCEVSVIINKSHERVCEEKSSVLLLLPTGMNPPSHDHGSTVSTLSRGDSFVSDNSRNTFRN